MIPWLDQKIELPFSVQEMEAPFSDFFIATYDHFSSTVHHNILALFVQLAVSVYPIFNLPWYRPRWFGYLFVLFSNDNLVLVTAWTCYISPIFCTTVCTPRVSGSVFPLLASFHGTADDSHRLVFLLKYICGDYYVTLWHLVERYVVMLLISLVMWFLHLQLPLPICALISSLAWLTWSAVFCPSFMGLKVPRLRSSCVTRKMRAQNTFQYLAPY